MEHYKLKCLLCYSNTEIIFSPSKDLAVSSDGQIIRESFRLHKCVACNHIQKKSSTDDYLAKKITSIYNNYDMFKLSNGKNK